MSRANPRFRRVNPALPAIPSGTAIVTFILQGLIEGQMTINMFSYANSLAPMTTAQLSAALTSFQSSFLTTYRAALSADWSLTLARAVCDTQPSLAVVVDTTNVGVAGTGPAGHEPTTVAAVISRYTGVKGQHGRGKYYVPAVPTGWVTGSLVTAVAGLTAYAALATAAPGNFSQGVNVYVPVIRTMAKVNGIRQAIGAATITQGIARNLLGTIRRRRIGRGK